MKIKKLPSIRRFLLLYLISALVISSIILGAMTYFGAKEELDELYDANLQQVALAIKSHYLQTTQNIEASAATLGQGKQITREEQFFVRITDNDDDVLYISHPGINLPPVNEVGFSTILYDHTRWRFYITYAQDKTIEVAQMIGLRKEATREIVLSLMVPQLLFIPIFGLLMWLTVGRSLLPLTILSTTIGGRTNALLEPVLLKDAPVEIAPLVSALNILLERVDKLLQVQKQFTSDAAHELRTPLTALKLQLALVKRSDDTKQREQAIAQLEAGIERAIAMVQQLLTLARIEPHAVTQTLTSVSLLSAVTESIQYFLPLTLDKKIDLGITHKSDVMINADKESLLILINNLIDNAIRHTPENGRIDISIIEHDGQVLLKIQDEGPGIKTADQDKVFNRFYRGSDTHTTGTGLGLAIVKEIADRHGAKIILDNNPGLCVTVSFLAG